MGKIFLSIFTQGQVKKHPHGCGEDEKCREANGRTKETPPRVWGRWPAVHVPASRHGNTPTGVGKICEILPLDISHKKHPHGCGEDSKILYIFYIDILDIEVEYS